MSKCKICKDEFTKRSTLQVVCSHKCAIELINRKKIKKAEQEEKLKKKITRERLLELKPITYWENRAQIAFNAYIRARDGNYCISCGTTSPYVQYCAGHYRTRKAANQLRFDEDNVHVQCNSYCNRHLSANIINYRPALIAKIGIERHDKLINNFFAKRWTKEECQEIEREYKRKLKLLKL